MKYKVWLGTRDEQDEEAIYWNTLGTYNTELEAEKAVSNTLREYDFYNIEAE
jgi:hypothetical protein